MLKQCTPCNVLNFDRYAVVIVCPATDIITLPPYLFSFDCAYYRSTDRQIEYSFMTINIRRHVFLHNLYFAGFCGLTSTSSIPSTNSFVVSHLGVIRNWNWVFVICWISCTRGHADIILIHANLIKAIVRSIPPVDNARVERLQYSTRTRHIKM